MIPDIQANSEDLMESTPSNFLTLLLILSFLHLSPANSPARAATFLPEKSLPTKSGYLPVNGTSGSAIFFAFYEAQQLNSEISKTPLLVWLQGGPGCSSMVGNFFEFGPWLVHSDPSDSKNPILKSNPGAWNRLFGLIFIDNPIGTGFSIATTEDEIPRDQNSVAKHLFIALQAFLSLNPSFKSRPLYITGESYAGKYVPAIGYYILQQNLRLPASRRVNLQGVAIGNGLTDPATQVATHAVTAYYSGLINARQCDQLEEFQAEAVKLTREGRWREATDARSHVLDWLQNATGLATLYDLRRKRPYETDMVDVLLQKEEVKAALGVKKGMVWEECSGVVGNALHEDVMKSVKFMVEDLVKKSRVLLYQGQFDLRDGVVSTEAWMKEMEWDGLERFLSADRNVWKVNGEVSGYVQRWGSLTHVVVSGAGHLVPADQGLSSQAMIEDWVLERGLFGDEKTVVSSFRGAL
ncbi:serine carboxypeptidase-like 50 [Magnolia sinica]|uniref:serine carboxypeptidase-like 50 n=1 Tax=Magnolia sinica TaxID=86752 RepID=UPI0026593464|nr:serine carboxypeptidase-like 50 [Magnolia sinica]